MTRLVVSKDLFSRYGKLAPAVRSRVEDLTTKCQQLSIHELKASKGLNLEPYEGQRDPRARTIRLGDNHRGIVMIPDEKEMIVLIDVLRHKEADRWMVSNEFRVNEATGALEIVDVAGLGELIAEAPAAVEVPVPDVPLLYAHRSDKEFTKLGVDAELLPLLRLMQNEDQLESLLARVPQGQADALILLTGTESTDVLFAALVGEEAPAAEVDTEDLAAAAAAAASRGQFHVVEDQADLAEMLAKPLAIWRTYLHPSQHEAAYRPTYNGPARVTGGAGTGKTVVAMHRAKALAESAPRTGDRRPILFTTFTRNLSQAIERDLVELGGADLAERVEVLNIDRVARQIVADAEGTAPNVIGEDQLRSIWQIAADEVGDDHPVTFLIQEWEQVILAQDIGSRDEYFTAPRAGRGTRLDRRERARVWKVVEAATGELARRRQRTFLQIAAAAAGYLANSSVKPYQHVIVDEAQDLHEAQWRLIRAAVAAGPNDIFIVGDSHQRIYDRRSSLSKVGIEVRGRSRRLRINYRTTHEILRWSLAVLGEGSFDDLDTGSEAQDRASYHSFLHGPAPTVVGFDTVADMAEGLADQIARWIEDGIDPAEIGVAARSQAPFGSLQRALRARDVPVFLLGKDLKAHDGVSIGTMHRMKGLEFRCMAVVGIGAGEVPSPVALAAVAGDPVEIELETRRERCLVYVACTRAREDLWVAYTGQPSPFIAAGTGGSA